MVKISAEFIKHGMCIIIGMGMDEEMERKMKN